MTLFGEYLGQEELEPGELLRFLQTIQDFQVIAPEFWRELLPIKVRRRVDIGGQLSHAIYGYFIDETKIPVLVAIRLDVKQFYADRRCAELLLYDSLDRQSGVFSKIDEGGGKYPLSRQCNQVYFSLLGGSRLHSSLLQRRKCEPFLLTVVPGG